jgi:hypothetical protein
MWRSYIAVGTLCGCMLIAAGCSSPHYRVTDPASGKEYFTTKVQEAGKGGAVKVKDAHTGSMVTLQSSEVKEISEDAYDAGIAAQQAKPQAVNMKPAPMQPASAQPAPQKPLEAQPAPVQPASVQPAQAEPLQK